MKIYSKRYIRNMNEDIVKWKEELEEQPFTICKHTVFIRTEMYILSITKTVNTRGIE